MEIAWLDVATAALRNIPDGRLLRLARRAGDHAVAVLEGMRQPGRLGNVLRSLGQVYAFPFVGLTSTADCDARLAEWRLRTHDEYGVEVIADPAAAMPEPVDALRVAETYYRRGVALLGGHDRGYGLYELHSVLTRLDRFGVVAAPAELRAVAREAFELIDIDREPPVAIELARWLKSAGEAVDDTRLARLLRIEPPPPTTLRAARDATILLRNRVSFLREVDPARALAAQEQANELPPEALAVYALYLAQGQTASLWLMARATNYGCTLTKYSGSICAAWNS